MKRVAVISDTHMPAKAKKLPNQLLEGIRGVDLIIHAGDITTDHVVYELQEIAPVEAVAGNNDDSYICSMFRHEIILEIEGFTLGVTHGEGSWKTARERAKRIFEASTVDCIIFGHSHIPCNIIEDGILYLNPGSPTDKRRQVRYSYAIMTIAAGEAEADIIYFDSKE